MLKNKVILTMVTKLMNLIKVCTECKEGVTQNCKERAKDIVESASDNSLSALNLVEQQKVSNQNRKLKYVHPIVQTFLDNTQK